MLAPPGKAGTLGGSMNFAGTSSGILVPLLAGFILQFTGTYSAVIYFFAACAVLYLTAQTAPPHRATGTRRILRRHT